MKIIKRKSLLICFAVCLISLLVVTVFAHPGRTDSNGGHTDHSTGEYHYHHGYSEHNHYDMDGDGTEDCPFNFVDKTDIGSGYSYTDDYQETQVETEITKEKKTEEKIIGEIAFAILFVFPLWYAISLFIAALVCKLVTTIFRFEDAFDTSFKIVTFVVFVAGIIIYYAYIK